MDFSDLVNVRQLDLKPKSTAVRSSQPIRLPPISQPRRSDNLNRYDVVSEGSSGSTSPDIEIVTLPPLGSEVHLKDAPPPANGSNLDLIPDILGKQTENEQQITALRQLLDDLKPKILDLVERDSHLPSGLDADQLKASIQEILKSTETQSIIANALSKGLGSAAGSAVVNTIFKGITTPFEVAGKVAGGIKDVAQGVEGLSGAVNKVTDSVERIKNIGAETSNFVRENFEQMGSALANIQSNTNPLQQVIKAQTPGSPVAVQDVLVAQAGLPRSSEFERIQKKKKITVFGSNSVVMVNVDDVIVYDKQLKRTQALVPNLWQSSVKLQQAWARSFTQSVNHGWSISSQLAWFSGSGEEYSESSFAYIVQEGIVNIPAERHVALPQITYTASLIHSSAMEAALAELRTAGQVNDRTVQNILNGTLHVANIAALRDVAHKLGERIFFYDNTYIYAKLCHYILVNDHFTWANVEATPQAWDSDINYVLLDSNDITWEQLAEPIDRGDIVVVDGYDWTNRGAVSLQLLHLLSSGGYRLACTEANTHGLAARYYQWKKVKVTVLIHLQNNPPAAPAVARLSSKTVWDFAYKLASDRNELHHLLKGLYAATEMLGTTLQYRGAGAADHDMVSVVYGSPNYDLPKPHDYNYLARFLGIMPTKASDEVITELESFVTRSVSERMATCAVYNAIIAAMATTTFAGINIRLLDIIRYSQDPAVAQDHNLQIIMKHLDEPMHGPSNIQGPYDVRLRVIARRLFTQYTGVTIPDNIWFQSPAFFGKNSLSQERLNLNYTGINNHWAPTRSLLFGLLGHLSVYPLEWGVSDRGAHFDIQKDVIDTGPPADRGWFSVMGDVKYGNTATGSSPHKLLMYGWNVLQCMCNRYWNQAAPALIIQTHTWAPGRMQRPWENAPDATRVAFTPQWNGVARCYNPCTFRSYDWDTNTVAAPALSWGNNWWKRYRHTDGDRPTAGLIVKSKTPSYEPPSTYGLIDMTAGIDIADDIGQTTNEGGLDSLVMRPKQDDIDMRNKQHLN